MITREADYAIRIVLCLSTHRPGVPISTTAVGKEMELPYRFLRKIVRHLTASGLLGTTRGKNGGVYLLRKPEEINMYQILELFDNKSLLFNQCGQVGVNCTRQSRCSVHHRMKTVQEKINDQLRQVSFAELANI